MFSIFSTFPTLDQAVAGSSLSNQTTFPVIVLAFIGTYHNSRFAQYCPKIMKIFSLFNKNSAKICTAALHKKSKILQHCTGNYFSKDYLKVLLIQILKWPTVAAK